MSNKASVITQLSGVTGLSKKASAALLEAVTDIFKRDLSNTGVALIPGIGKLKVTDRAERAGRNPRTGEALQIPARKAVKFKASTSLKAEVQ